MKDRFKFRAKRIDNNQWYYGCYLFLKNPPQYDWSGQKKESKGDIHFIIDENDINYAIDPQTLGQCTGLKDKNGKLIFEGDLIKIKDEVFVVIYWRGEFTAESLNHKVKQEERQHFNWYNFCYPSNQPIIPEVIGNIYENPELLKGGEK